MIFNKFIYKSSSLILITYPHLLFNSFQGLVEEIITGVPTDKDSAITFPQFSDLEININEN